MKQLADYVSPDHIGCVELARIIYDEMFDVILPDDPWQWLSQFVETRHPREADIVTFRMRLRDNTTGRLTNHIGVMLDGRSFIHSMEGVGRTIGFLDRRPWSDPQRVAGFMRYKKGLTLRADR